MVYHFYELDPRKQAKRARSKDRRLWHYLNQFTPGRLNLFTASERKNDDYRTDPANCSDRRRGILLRDSERYRDQAAISLRIEEEVVERLPNKTPFHATFDDDEHSTGQWDMSNLQNP
jgi:hypothetical protein